MYSLNRSTPQHSYHSAEIAKARALVGRIKIFCPGVFSKRPSRRISYPCSTTSRRMKWGRAFSKMLHIHMNLQAEKRRDQAIYCDQLPIRVNRNPLMLSCCHRCSGLLKQGPLHFREATKPEITFNLGKSPWRPHFHRSPLCGRSEVRYRLRAEHLRCDPSLLFKRKMLYVQIIAHYMPLSCMIWNQCILKCEVLQCVVAFEKCAEAPTISEYWMESNAFS